MSETITIAKSEYDSMKETLEIASDKDLMEDIRQGIDDIRKGKTVSLDEYLNKK